MAKVKRSKFYYCLVPCCPNTTVTAPEKIFLAVPKDREKRDIWSKAMKRDSTLSTKTSHRCCEDHFKLEEDLDNYWRWKLTNDVQKLRLKKGVVPHIFECQKRNMIPVERKTTVKKKKEMVCDRHFKEGDVEFITSFYKEETGETLTAKLKVPRLKKGATPEIFPDYPSKSRSTKNAVVASKKGQKLSKSKKRKSPKKTFRKTKSQSSTESTIAIKQKRINESPSIVIDNAIFNKELLPLNAISCSPENAMPVSNLDSTNVDETSGTTKPERLRETKIFKSMHAGITPNANQVELNQFDKSSLPPSKSEMSENFIEPFTVIKQEPVDEPPSLFVDNVQSFEESLRSKSDLSIPGNLCLSLSSPFSLIGNTDSTNKKETSVTIKHERQRKTKILKSMYAGITPETNQSESYRLDESSLLSRESEISQNAIKQEPADEPPPLAIDNVQIFKESKLSKSGSYFSSNLGLGLSSLSVSDLDSHNKEEISVTTKPKREKQTKKLESMCAEIIPKANQTELRQLDKSSSSSRESEMSQNITEPLIVIKQEPVEEPPPLVIDNVQSVHESIASDNGSSSSENVCMSLSSFPVGNIDSTNKEETSVPIKPERKRKINIAEPDSSDSKHAKLHLPANPPMLPKKASGRSISPTENTRNATRDIFLSLLGGSETNPLPGFRSSEKPGDLFDVFASFIADKLRAMNWDDCAVILRSILDMVFTAGQVHQSSDEDDEEEIGFSNSYTNSSPPSEDT